jgi:hypothetical protein
MVSFWTVNQQYIVPHFVHGVVACPWYPCSSEVVLVLMVHVKDFNVMDGVAKICEENRPGGESSWPMAHPCDQLLQ